MSDDEPNAVATESANARYGSLERLEGEALTNALLEGQNTAFTAIADAVPALTRVIERASKRLRSGNGRIVYVGAGTSGRIAVQDGAELHPTFNWPMERLVFLLAGGSESLMVAREGAEDDIEAGANGIADMACGPDDVVFALAASGTTPYTIAAVEAAKRAGALTVGIANNKGSPLAATSEEAIELSTGAEVLAGSTRMAAGTSQKIALNILSTGIMVRLNKVYRGRMVDMRTTNAKLRRRAVAMVMDLAGCDADGAERALETTKYDLKTAILVAHGHALSQAKAMLVECDGDLGAALGEARA
ncbi:N-acetylmuramic acid 6-phosphate etherase [Pararhizobium mangrovi]|uniref:N-acetylmuramic acid 6-phosphate etherase n=1 Tax=Pararhizobium mangrovi TaxID=2590452 RepID=A0A506U015_9HYPH|nr:N-acetylmuramic acid 6-phosphate etherase [Pararhizobium mangrovi]TPW26315.1 N-acetylmuramic acid 6-phosphate etherase [Pararhizobium mangrovi]